MENLANILILIAGVLWGVEMIPQIIKTCKTRNVEGISLSFFCMCGIAYVLYAVGNILLGNWIIYLAHVPSVVLNFWMITLIIRCKRRKNDI